MRFSTCFLTFLARLSIRFLRCFLARFLARFPTRFSANVVAPVVVRFLVVGDPHRLVVIVVVALLDDVVEPFPDRHAGLASGVAGGFALFWTKTSEIPRTAGFHCAPNHFGRSEMAQ